MRFIVVRRASSGSKFISKSPKNVLLPASLITLGVTGTVSLAEKNRECQRIARKMQRGVILGKNMFIEAFSGAAIGVYIAEQVIIKSFYIFNFLNSYTQLPDCLIP